MTQQFTLAGDGTLVLSYMDGSDEMVISELASQTAIGVAFPNDTGTMEALKGGAVYSVNVAAKQATLTIRVVKAGKDDAWLNTKLNTFLNNNVSSKALNASVIGNFGDGSGNLRKLTCTLIFGFIKKRVDLIINYSGDNSQAVSEYTVDFGLSELVFN